MDLKGSWGGHVVFVRGKVGQSWGGCSYLVWRRDGFDRGDPEKYPAKSEIVAHNSWRVTDCKFDFTLSLTQFDPAETELIRLCLLRRSQPSRPTFHIRMRRDGSTKSFK